MVDEAPYLSDYTGQGIYYRSVQEQARVRLPVDPRLPVALGHRLVLVLAGARRAAPAVRRSGRARWRRSDVYRRLVALDRRYGLSQPLETPARGRRRRADHPGRRGPGDRLAGVPRLLPRARSGSPGVGVPVAAARATHAGRSTRSSPTRPTSTSASGPTPSSRPGRRPTTTTGASRRSHGARRTQVAVLHGELHPGGVRRPVRRRVLPPAQGALRPAGPPAGPLHQVRHEFAGRE